MGSVPRFKLIRLCVVLETQRKHLEEQGIDLKCLDSSFLSHFVLSVRKAKIFDFDNSSLSAVKNRNTKKS